MQRFGSSSSFLLQAIEFETLCEGAIQRTISLFTVPPEGEIRVSETVKFEEPEKMGNVQTTGKNISVSSGK
jgi:hypothetical protein